MTAFKLEYPLHGVEYLSLFLKKAQLWGFPI